MNVHDRMCDHCPPPPCIVVFPAKDQMLINEGTMGVVAFLGDLVVGVEIVCISRAAYPYQGVGRGVGSRLLPSARRRDMPVMIEAAGDDATCWRMHELHNGLSY